MNAPIIQCIISTLSILFLANYDLIFDIIDNKKKYKNYKKRFYTFIIIPIMIGNIYIIVNSYLGSKNDHDRLMSIDSAMNAVKLTYDPHTKTIKNINVMPMIEFNNAKDIHLEGMTLEQNINSGDTAKSYKVLSAAILKMILFKIDSLHRLSNNRKILLAVNDQINMRNCINQITDTLMNKGYIIWGFCQYTSPNENIPNAFTIYTREILYIFSAT